MSNQTPDAIRDDVERQREQLAETVDALHDALETQAKAAVNPAVIGLSVTVVALVGYVIWRRRR